MCLDQLEVVGVLVVLIWANPHLFGGAAPAGLVFSTAGVLAGEWWRCLTHPFVHVGWYHLLLDVGAFIWLSYALRARPFGQRVLICAASAAVGLTLSLLILPESLANGFCGLSGIAHGLMAVAALDGIRSTSRERLWSWCWLILLLGKCICELALDPAFMQPFHLGNVGTPLPLTHAGGALGGIAAWLSLPAGKQR